jgi:amidohydrolase
MMAAMEFFELKIIGKSGHGATPHRAIDAVTMAAQIVTALQTIVSREIDPTDTAVVTIGQIIGGTAGNIVAGEVILRGTTRAYRPQTQQCLRQRIEEIAGGITAAMHGQYEFRITCSYPPVVNDPAFTDEFAAIAREVLGPDHVAEISQPSMGGEDMAFFLQKAPGTFFFLAGCNADKGQVFPHHHSKFDIDEEILWRGSALFAAFALRWLR